MHFLFFKTISLHPGVSDVIIGKPAAIASKIATGQSSIIDGNKKRQIENNVLKVFLMEIYLHLFFIFIRPDLLY